MTTRKETTMPAIYVPSGPPRPPLIERDARFKLWMNLKHQETTMRIHLVHLHHTEPPVWELLTHNEMAGLQCSFENLTLKLNEYRLRADVDTGPMNGRRKS